MREPTRRVEGLRREEVARLAGISAEYYLRLEQGRSRQPSEQVLAGLSKALRLDADAAYHLRVLAFQGEMPPAALRAEDPDPATINLVHCLRDVGALLVDLNFDVVDANALGETILPGVAAHPVNLIHEIARRTEEPAERERVVAEMLAVLRFLGTDRDPRRDDVVDSLTLGSPALRAAWDRHDVRRPGPFQTSLESCDIGVIPVQCQVLLLASTPHALVTVMGMNDARGRATMRYLQTLSDERADRSGSGNLVLTDTGSVGIRRAAVLS
ncbi:helix-turn-helix domain-containing protein [Microbacterium sp. p3-SID336]|uniref:helix-turn-helix domain-containing protein n=1 Tax=Microbacterium sp. p3-SID336 TaxID=2916212 RepID=UPI0037C6CA43|nr:helix-turn-helix domain-containing protein [Microbacterium sp. p3-SID336]